jgi:hypothetical protein
MIAPSVRASDPIPTPIRHQIERSRPVKIDIPIKRGEYLDLQLQYLDYGQPVDLRTVQALYFVISASAFTNSYPARIMDATNGIVGFLLTPTNLFYPNSYTWELPVCGQTSVSIRAFGTISVSPSIGYQNLTNTPPPLQTLDLATTLLYNIGYSPWATYAWITNYVGAHGGGFVGWADVQDKPALYTQAQVDVIVSNLTTQIQGIATNPPAGGGGTNITINSMSVTVTNLTVQQGGTNVNYYAATDDSKWPTNQPIAGAFVWTNAGGNSAVINAGVITVTINTNSGSGGLSAMPSTWDGDLIGTNSLDIKVGGMRMLEFTTNGIIMHYGTIQMYEEQLWANVELYDGTRLAPALTFRGHPGEWGLYARGYNGNYVAGWSVGGIEQGLLGRGVILMDTNAAFVGRLVGDISGATGYPEPIFMNWYTNQWVFNALSISNLTMLNGPITVKDSLNTTRGTLDATGLTVNDAGGVTRSTYGAQSISLKNTSGLTTTTLDTSLKLKDSTSGNTLLDVGGTYADSIIQRWPTGQTVWQIGYLYGLQFYDQIAYFQRTRIGYNGINLIDSNSNFVFSVDSQYSKIAVALGMSITNSGNLVFYGNNGTNLCTITGSTGAVKIRGVDSDLRYVTNVRTNMTGFQLTNLWAGVTNILWYNSQGIVTNKTP